MKWIIASESQMRSLWWKSTEAYPVKTRLAQHKCWAGFYLSCHINLSWNIA